MSFVKRHQKRCNTADLSACLFRFETLLTFHKQPRAARAALSRALTACPGRTAASVSSGVQQHELLPLLATAFTQATAFLTVVQPTPLSLFALGATQLLFSPFWHLELQVFFGFFPITLLTLLLDALFLLALLILFLIRDSGIGDCRTLSLSAVDVIFLALFKVHICITHLLPGGHFYPYLRKFATTDLYPWPMQNINLQYLEAEC